MKYIIFYDENYKTQVKKELGNFEELAEGVGLFDDENFDSNQLDREVKEMLAFLNLQFPILAQDLLKNSIFVRHFFKVDSIENQFNTQSLETLMKKYEKQNNIN